MRTLFLHDNFPAQFPHVATALAKDNAKEVIYSTLKNHETKNTQPAISRLDWRGKRQKSVS